MDSPVTRGQEELPVPRENALPDRDGSPLHPEEFVESESPGEGEAVAVVGDAGSHVCVRRLDVDGDMGRTAMTHGIGEGLVREMQDILGENGGERAVEVHPERN